MKKFFVFVAGFLGFLVGIAVFFTVVPEFVDSTASLSFLGCVLVSLLVSTLSSSKSKKLLAVLFGSSLGGITAIIIDSWFRYDNNAIYLAPLVSYITTRIVLESKTFNGIGIRNFFRSKVWLILQIVWVILVIFTAKYDSYYPQKVYLFWSFPYIPYSRTSGLIQVLLVTLPFITNIYFWLNKSNKNIQTKNNFDIKNE
jgi:hypothetical protein